MGADPTSPTPAVHRSAGFVARRPALLAAIVLALGIFAHRVLPAWPIALLALIALAIVCGVALRHRGALASVCIATAIALSGALGAQLERYYFQRDQIGLFATDARRLAQLELVIDNEPRILTDFFSGHPLPPKQVVDASVVRVLTKSGWVDATGEILVQIVQPHPRLAIGQRVRVLGMLERPAPAMNPGQFDRAAYYREQRILASIHIPTAANIQILSESGRGPGDWIRAQARRLLAMGFPGDRSLDHALLGALLLGDHDPEIRDIQELFRKTGTSHHLAISGMHVAVLSGFVLGICRLLRMRPRRALTIMLIFACVYGTAALPSPPVVRSILLCLFFGFGMLGGRALNAMQLLGASVVAMLVWHPLDLYNAGFQLSVGTVLGMMILTPVFARWVTSLREGSLALPPQFHHVLSNPLGNTRPGIFDRLRAAARWAESSLAAAFAAGVIAWIVSVPLIAFHFGQLNLWAIAASIILAPIVLIAMIGGLFKVVLTLLLPGFAHAWAMVAAMPMVWMRGTLGWLAKLPLSDYPLPAWPVWGLVIVYAFYALFIIPCRQSKLRLCVRALPMGVLGTALVLPFRSVESAVVAPQELRLTMLSVGAGQAAVLEAPSGKTILLDAGSTSLSDPLRKCIAPFLRSRGCTKIDTLLLTHSDYDHVSAAAGVASVYDVSQVLLGGQFRRTAAENSTALALLQALDSLDLPPTVVAPGQHIPLSRGVEMEILWPPQSDLAQTLTSNESAVVARITYASKSILITGDIQEMAQRELLKDPSKLKADVLIAPHHGSSESTTAAFVRAVDPTAIISSNDRSLTGKQKRFEKLIGDRKLFRTNVCGAITVHLRADGTVDVEPFIKPG